MDPLFDYLHRFRVSANGDLFFKQLREKELISSNGVWGRGGMDNIMAVRIPIESNMYFLDNCFRLKKENNANISTV